MSNNHSHKKTRIVLNSPVTLTFSFLCLITLGINMLTEGYTNVLLFSVYRASFTDLLTYLRFFLHVLGHASISHLSGNIMMLLLLGPVLEEKYGSKAVLLVIVLTAFITGLAHFILFPGVMLLGASGVVFAFILLSAASGFKTREIPLTFIIVAVLYIGEQIYEGIFVSDSVSQLTHILGGITGAVFGYRRRKK